MGFGLSIQSNILLKTDFFDSLKHAMCILKEKAAGALLSLFAYGIL